MKTSLIAAILCILPLLLVLPMILSADDWVLLPVQITTNQTQFDTDKLGSLTQMEFRVVGVAPHAKSEPSENSQTLIIVAQDTPQALIDSLKAKGYAVAVDGVSTIRILWNASTYTIMAGTPPEQQTVEVGLYELYVKEVSKVSGCTKPGTLSIAIE